MLPSIARPFLTTALAAAVLAALPASPAAAADGASCPTGPAATASLEFDKAYLVGLKTPAGRPRADVCALSYSIRGGESGSEICVKYTLGSETEAGCHKGGTVSGNHIADSFTTDAGKFTIDLTIVPASGEQFVSPPFYNFFESASPDPAIRQGSSGGGETKGSITAPTLGTADQPGYGTGTSGTSIALPAGTPLAKENLLLDAQRLGSMRSSAADAAATPTVPDRVDCDTYPPAGGADDRTCSQQGSDDMLTNPATHAAWALDVKDPLFTTMRERTTMEPDPLRYPPMFWDGKRGHWKYFQFTAPYGKATFMPQGIVGTKVGAQMFWPLEECTIGHSEHCPKGVPLHPAGPYPAIVIEGGAFNGSNELAWLAEELAEYGYVTMTVNQFGSESNSVNIYKSMLDYILSTKDKPSPEGEVNPQADVVDRDHVGLIGYSNYENGTGGVHEAAMDPRVDAYAYGIFNGDRPEWARPADDDKPGLFFSHEDGAAAGDDTVGGINAIKTNRGADLIVITPRSATHFDMISWNTQGNAILLHTRYGPQVAAYYSRAFFDKELWGPRDEAIEADATRRITASTFDDSVDEASIGSGTYDAAKAAAAGDPLAGNEPPLIAGQKTKNRLSFLLKSGYSLNNGTLTCLDMQGGC